MLGVTVPAEFHVVALVSSAGGLEATGEVLGALPAHIPAAVIVLQHTTPDVPSLLSDILARRTALPVAAATDRAQLRAGTVLVAPAGWHTLVTPARTVSLIRSGAYPPSRPSADLLLTSVALSCGRDSIAVVLSGGGHDAATGAAAIHHHGGTVLATDQATSQHYAMPAAAAARGSKVAVVLPLTQIAPLLLQLINAHRAGPSPSGQ